MYIIITYTFKNISSYIISCHRHGCYSLKLVRLTWVSLKFYKKVRLVYFFFVKLRLALILIFITWNQSSLENYVMKFY